MSYRSRLLTLATLAICFVDGRCAEPKTSADQSDPIETRNLIGRVIAIARLSVNMCGLKHTDLVIMPQHANAELREFGDFSDLIIHKIRLLRSD